MEVRQFWLHFGGFRGVFLVRERPNCCWGKPSAGGDFIYRLPLTESLSDKPVALCSRLGDLCSGFVEAGDGFLQFLHRIAHAPYCTCWFGAKGNPSLVFALLRK